VQVEEKGGKLLKTMAEESGADMAEPGPGWIG
jgi:hypothetical protein